MSRRFGPALVGIALAGLALRVAWVLLGDWSPDRLLADADFYHRVANSLGAGHGFASPELPGAPATALHPPLHSLLLALPSALGLDSWTAHRLTTALMGSLTVGLVGLLGRRVAGARAGLLAAGLAAVYPVFVRIDGAVLSESLYGALVALILLAALSLLDRPAPARALVLGALIGLAALTRAEALLLLPLLAVPAAWAAGGRRALHGGLACLAVIAVLLPWSVRNWTAFDRVVPISTNSGTTLAGANCAATYGGPNLGLWSFGCLSARKPGEDEVEQSARLREQGVGHARAHAGRLPVVVPVRVLRTWDLYQPLRQANFAEGLHTTLYRVGLTFYYPLALLALGGAVLLARRRRTLLVLLAPVMLVTVTSAFFYGVPRFRYAAEIPLLVLAAVAIEALADRALAGRRPAPLEAAA